MTAMKFSTIGSLSIIFSIILDSKPGNTGIFMYCMAIGFSLPLSFYGWSSFAADIVFHSAIKTSNLVGKFVGIWLFSVFGIIWCLKDLMGCVLFLFSCSSQFALRSYLYINFHELVGLPASWLNGEEKVKFPASAFLKFAWWMMIPYFFSVCSLYSFNLKMWLPSKLK